MGTLIKYKLKLMCTGGCGRCIRNELKHDDDKNVCDGVWCVIIVLGECRNGMTEGMKELESKSVRAERI